MSTNAIGPLPEHLERLLGDLMGSNWRFLPEQDINGAWGVAIIYAVLNGCAANIAAIGDFLKVDKWRLQKAFRGLSLNGVFQRDKIEADRKSLESGDQLTWLYYAGYASQATGNVTER